MSCWLRMVSPGLNSTLDSIFINVFLYKLCGIIDRHFLFIATLEYWRFCPMLLCTVSRKEPDCLLHKPQC